MFKTLFTIILLTTVSVQAISQKKLFTRSGIISFYSKTDVENIEAKNSKVLAVIDLENNKIEFALLIKGFEFQKALMQEHFNEKYLESDKYPKAVFKGSFVEKVNGLDINSNKIQTVQVTGNLTIHGVTKAIKTTATFTVKNRVISANSTFTVLLSDYNIKVPGVFADNISKEIQVKINIPSLEELK